MLEILLITKLPQKYTANKVIAHRNICDALSPYCKHKNSHANIEKIVTSNFYLVKHSFEKNVEFLESVTQNVLFKSLYVDYVGKCRIASVFANIIFCAHPV